VFSFAIILKFSIKPAFSLSDFLDYHPMYALAGFDRTTYMLHSEDDTTPPEASFYFISSVLGVKLGP
jgi:hypothetical protein